MVPSHLFQVISLVRSMDLDSHPKPESKLMSLITQTVSLFNSMNLDSQPKPLSDLISRISSLVKSKDLDSQRKKERDDTFVKSLTSQVFSTINSSLDSVSESSIEALVLKQLTLGFTSALGFQYIFESVSQLFPSRDPEFIALVAETLSLEPEPPEIISLVNQILSLVISMNSKWEKLISFCSQVEVNMEEGKFRVTQETMSRRRNNKWECLPWNWEMLSLTGEEDTHFLCRGCKGKNHHDYEKAPAEIKHSLHPRHALQLVFLQPYSETRECYCCDKALKGILYYCSACDIAIHFACLDKPPVLSVDHPKWHEHTLALFPSLASFPCNLCALTHSSCPFYICPPCDFVVHKSCINLPRVIRISRHPHRVSFTLSFDQGELFCGVCRRKIDRDYGGYFCIEDGCSFAAHSKCATQSNVWDGIELEGKPEEIEEEVEPFVRISDGIIQHFSHQQHHLSLNESTCIGFDENRQCQACVTPIYLGNFYSCMQCDYILHEACANFPCKLHHPIHPHLLKLVGGYDGVIEDDNRCSICKWSCRAGFSYQCSKEGCQFQLDVQCATISEPLVHESHMHPLFLTSKPGEKKWCCVCKFERTDKTFNCIECEFSLCFRCATLPHTVRYKHDNHMLTLSYGKEGSTITYW
ncbi:unnamed protein product [Eruca vesicaria subsp. sativa]|uniref:DC1 domain-containing protein n=1 Tax=Eruca vesicaria subsp. sativa TaxID=29727 RepID=A0ABC8JVV6_ERUVS|nr:unnamed protein product [Eruca vesicaria subsp. sativa]